MRWCRLPRDLASVEILNSTSWNRLNIFQISSFRLSFPNSVYIVRREERERDILWLDKPWSVRIVSIACHPSIHLSILETLYTTCPFQELILSSESTYYTPLPLHRCDETAECAECLQYPARRGTQLANSSVFSGLQLHHSSIPLPPRHPTFVVSGIKDGRIKTEKSSAA